MKESITLNKFIMNKTKYWYIVKKAIPKRYYNSLLSVYFRLRSVFYHGKKVTCPICENSFRKFLHNPTGQCPKCGSGGRHRTLFLFLQRKTNFFTAKLKVLHFAPEHCFYKLFKSFENIEYLSADLNSSRAMEKIDITNINYPNDSFDVILSSHVLEHIDNDHLAMTELNRIQRINGWSIHLVPIDYSRTITYEDPEIDTPSKRLNIYGHHDHKRVYGKDYPERLESVGFNVKSIGIFEFIQEEEICFLGLNKKSVIYLCTK